MSTTVSRTTVILPLPSTTAARRPVLYSVLEAGWLRVAYRKANGEQVIRLGTRNPSIVGTYGSSSDVRTLREWEETNDLSDDQILYYDYLMGGLRSFRISQVDFCGFDHRCPEINH